MLGHGSGALPTQMKLNRSMLLLFALTALLCGASKKPPKEEMPLSFTVVQSAAGDGCFMLLLKTPADDWIYHVKEHSVVRCYIWPRGTVLPGRFRKSRGLISTELIDLLAKDDKGRDKIFTYTVFTKSSK